MTRGNTVLPLILAALFLIGVAADSVAAPANRDQHGSDHENAGSPAESAADWIRHANTFYWFAMAQRGNMSAIEHGLHCVHEAEHLLEAAHERLKQGRAEDAQHLSIGTTSPPPHHDGVADQVNRAEVEKVVAQLETKAAAIATDLEYQRELAYNTHYGVFPMSRFVTSSLFSDPRASGSFELLDPPNEVAVREAVEDLATIESEAYVPQYDIVFISDLPDPDLAKQMENEALYVFNRSPRFFVHNWLEVKTALTGDEVQQLCDLAPTAETLEKLRGQFGINDLLLVRLRKIDDHDGYFFFVAEGRVFGPESAQPTLVLHNFGFCVDRTAMLVPILLLHGGLLLVSMVLYALLVKVTSHARRLPTWQNTLVFGAGGFLWGRCLIWVLAPMLGAIEPDAETLAWWSFWWAAATGVVFTLGPAVILGFADRRFNWFGSAFATFNRGGALFASISLGSGAFLAQSALLYQGAEGWKLLPPLLLATVLASFTVGRALDKTDALPVTGGILAGILTLFLGVAWCHANPALLWLSVIPLVAISTYSVWHTSQPLRRSVETDAGPAPQPAASTVPANAHELAERAYDPPYVEPPYFDRFMEALQPWHSGQTIRVGLIGPAGAGKSATLRAIEARSRKRDSRLMVLRGTCHQPQSDSTNKPYEPFAEAIAEHFAVNLLAPQADQMHQVDEALGGIFDRVVPFADILFPPGEQSQTGSKRELFLAITAMLRRLASHQPVLLVLDDAHWMDPASLELLEFLLEEFPATAACPLSILVASRTEPTFAAGTERLETLVVDRLGTEHLRQIVVDGLGLHSDLAADVLSAADQQRGNLHWLFQIVAHLAQKGLLLRREDGFTWKNPGTKISEHLPDDFRQSVEELLAENRDFRSVLDCAACVGQEFTVDQISRGVGMSRLELIQLLDRIEDETGIVSDLRTKDDTFAFRSAFLLEVLRQAREIDAGGPRHSGMPQRIREYHHRLAKALETTLHSSNAALYDVANHYYAAGARQAAKALEYAIKAARAASYQFQHDLARKYMAMAQECAALVSAPEIDFARELLLIQCHQTHVEGKQRVEMAQQALEYLGEHPNSDFDVFRAVALACYDAGIDTRDQQHFSACVAVAQEMLDRFTEPAQQAEAYHFWGIGLPRTEANDRLQHLRTARELAETAYQANEKNLEILRLRSRIFASLAEQFSAGSAAEQAEARALYELSIEIKQREDVRDLEGLALAHGGLGRLAFFAETPDCDAARHHFEEDLRYSEKIGSVTGQTKMHSLLGQCDLSDGAAADRLPSALQHYEAAYELAEERFDAFFALAGLLCCHGGLGHADQVHQHGEQLVELVESGIGQLPAVTRETDPISAIPGPCRDSIRAALQQCTAYRTSVWHQWLTELLDHNRLLSLDGDNATSQQEPSGDKSG